MQISSDNAAPALSPQPSALGKTKVALLASGRGSNLQALIDAQHEQGLPIELVIVASDKAHAPALRRAEAVGIATLALDPKAYADRTAFDTDLFTRIASHAPDLIVLAGFMRILSPAVLVPWAGRIVNIHPSLLPKYPGLHTHRRALDAGDELHGATVHYVTAELDGGPPITRVEIPVHAGDTPDALAQRLLHDEHRLLVATIALIASGRIALAANEVHYDGARLHSPLRLAADGQLHTPA
jgi:phosphoribosylglycinamide formyltransferase-1